MNSFNYKQDPLYNAAAAILQGRICESLNESHFNVGDNVTCIESGMSGKIIKVDKPETGKYYHVKREDGKIVQYAPSELKAANINEDTKTLEEADDSIDYWLNKWRETGRIAFRRPTKKQVSLNGGPNMDEKKAVEYIKAFFAKNKDNIKEDQSLTESVFSKDALKSILHVMETQSFYDWYEKDFTDYIQGDADGKTQEEILDDLKDFFN